MGVYNNFAKDFNLKRKKPWKPFVEFYEIIENEIIINGTILDAGCGNGRNIPIIGRNQNNIRIIGIDNSIELLKIIRNQKNNRIKNRNSYLKTNEVELILSDLNYLPFQENILDYIFAIASIHHLIGKKNRSIFIQNIFNLMKVNGSLILSIWRKWQKRFRNYFIKDWFKRKFSSKYRKIQIKTGLHAFGDIVIPWKKSNGKVRYVRYYHLFSKREALNIIKQFHVRKFSKLGGPGKKDNFFIWTQKLPHKSRD